MKPAGDRAADRAAHTGPAGAGWLRWALMLVVLGVFVAIAVREGGRAWDGLRALSPVTLLFALAAAIGAICCSMLAWRALLADLGSPLRLRSAARIFFVGQLAKYVPGSVFVVVAQMELGRDLGVPRQRSGTASLLLYPVSVCSAVVVALLAVPFATADALDRYWPVVLVVPVALAALHPKVLGPALGRLLRLARRQPLERLPSSGGTVRAVALSVVAFLLLGVHVWLLARDLGADSGWRLFLLATGAMAAAWTAGFLVVISPGGAGIRELALVALLAPVLDGGTAVALALLSRAVMIGADGLVAGLAAYAGRGEPARHRILRRWSPAAASRSARAVRRGAPRRGQGAMTVAMAAAEKPARRSVRLPPPDPRQAPPAWADTTERTSPVTDSVRLRHRQGPARIVGGVPYSDRSSTLSLLPGAAVGSWLARQAPLVHGRLLDLGCGNQPFLPWYEPMVKEIVPVDAAPLPGVLVVDLSAPLPFPEGSFDTILCTSVLEHVDNAEQAMTEIARLLRPGGHALISVPFLYPTHEAPYDFWRCTHLGLSGLVRRHGLEVASLDAQGGPILMITHYGVLALTAGIRAAARALGPLGWLVDNRVVRGVLAAPQEAFRSRVSTRLGPTAKLASLGYMVVARKPTVG